MSGGVFGYSDAHAKNEIFGYDKKFSNVFEDREISELIFDVFDLIHDYDWYASGDTSEDTYLKAKAEFKKKWLKHDGERVKRVIDTAIDEVREELYKTYGVTQTDCYVSDLCKHYSDKQICGRCRSRNLFCEVESQTDWYKIHDPHKDWFEDEPRRIDTCKYDICEDDYDLYDMCEPMVEGECRYEPMDEPQTDCSWK